MKSISTLGLLIVLGGCSTHTVKCHGPLRPINKPAVNAAGPGSRHDSTSLPKASPGVTGRDGPADPFRTEPQP
jgi:hypothetical protein